MLPNFCIDSHFEIPMDSISIELNAISFQISNKIFVRSRFRYCRAQDDDTIFENILFLIHFEAQKNLNWKFKLNIQCSMVWLKTVYCISNGFLFEPFIDERLVIMWIYDVDCRWVDVYPVTISMNKQSITEGTKSNNYHITTMSPVFGYNQANWKEMAK